MIYQIPFGLQSWLARQPSVTMVRSVLLFLSVTANVSHFCVFSINLSDFCCSANINLSSILDIHEEFVRILETIRFEWSIWIPHGTGVSLNISFYPYVF